MSFIQDAVSAVGDLVGGSKQITSTTTTQAAPKPPLNLTPIYIGVAVVTVITIIFLVTSSRKSAPVAA